VRQERRVERGNGEAAFDGMICGQGAGVVSCSRNARPRKDGEGNGRPSPGLVARHGKSIAKQSEGRAGEKYLPVGGRVRKLHAIETTPAPWPVNLFPDALRVRKKRRGEEGVAG